MAVLDQTETPVNPRAPQPAPPVRQFSFTDFQVNNPTAPPPGDRLDGEIDRTNLAVEEVIAWAGTSLNSDGSLKPHSIGAAEIDPAVFDEVRARQLDELRPLIADARSAAEMAVSLANEADASALAADARANWAADSGNRAATDAQDAADSAAEAAQSALEAAASAEAAEMSANHADGFENSAEAWSWVSVEWAEHMPDTIPPNILATNGITGEHWSSRWWAHRAHEIVIEDTAEAICQIEHYWLGAYPSPPLVDSCDQPITPGAMYYNTTMGVTQVYAGGLWHNVVQPVPGIADEYIFLPSTPTTVFTGLDFYGKTVTIDPLISSVAVFLNGVRLLPSDYSITTNTVTMLTAPVGPPNTVAILVFNREAVAPPQPIGVKINTGLWIFDGRLSFPLTDSVGATIDPPSAIDCVVSLNGVVQEGGVDYTTRPGWIDFAVAPEPDADRWMVVGLPMGGSGGGSVAAAGLAPPPTPSGILIPYYLIPGDPYADANAQRLIGLMRQYHDVPVAVVLNPSDGPGSSTNANYAATIKLFKAAGAKVYGYVATGFALRPLADVKTDIDAWRSLYAATPVDGIFLDEQSWETGPGNVGNSYVTLYKQYTDYCHVFGLTTIANPGTNQQPAYFSTYTADVIIVHENSSYPLEADMAGNYVGGHADYSFTRRAALVYGQATLDTAALATLRRYTQWVYVTGDVLANPWDTLPSYLEQLFASLTAAPPPTYSVGLSFVGGVLSANQLLGLHKLPRAVTFPANFSGSTAGATANAAASTVISIDRALAASPNTFSAVGTLTFAAGGIAVTFASTGGAAVSCAAGDVLRLIGPATADTTLANVYATLVGA